MKAVVTSDWHLDAVTAGVRRFEELRGAVNASVDHAISTSASAYFFLGDLCDPDTGSAVFRCIEVVQEAALKLDKHGIDSFWMAGNHDVIEDGSGDTVLSPLRALHSMIRETNIVVVERPMVRALFDRSGNGDAINVIFLPFTATSHHYSPKDFIEENMSNRPTIIAGHLSIPNIVAGEETTEMARGRDIFFPYDAIMAKRTAAPLLLMNGHYHKRQAFRPDVTDEIPIHIPGSLARLRFGPEMDCTPVFLSLEL